jgi:hypothetical protein
MTVGLGGVDDRYLVFESSLDDRPVKLMIPDKTIGGHLAAIGAPRSIIDAVAGAIQKKSRRAMGRTGILVVLGIGIVVIGAVIWLGFGWAVGRAVSLVPTAWESSLGRAAASGVLESTKVCGDPALTRAMGELGTRLVGGLGATPFKFTVRVLDSDEVNAFALPGGYLFVNRGLIEQADDSFEVAGVLAHEIEHAVLRHGMHNILREAGVMLLLSAVVGDVGAIEQFLLYNAASLTRMSFSREQESAADAAGLDLMYRAGLDPTGLSRFLAKLASKEGTMGGALSLLSTHPASAERVGELNAAIAARPAPVVTPLRFDLTAFKGQCNPVALSDPDGTI